jgi:mannose-6-phosphate isomerase-like protein (cupin superfamily)
MNPVIVSPGEGRDFGDGLLCRITSASTGGAYCACEQILAPGQGVPLHVHSRDDEVYYILEGQYEIQCGERSFTAEAGAMVVIPRGIPHAFHNPADTPSRALMLFIPGGFDEFVAELNRLPPEDAVDENKRDVVRRKYGVEVLRPGAAAQEAASE